MSSAVRNSWYVFFVLLGLTLLFFYPSLSHPFLDIDELIWGGMANTIAQGCPPYLCVAGEKMPLLYLTMGGIFSLFGKNQYFVLHIIHLFWIAGTAWLLTRIPEKRPSWLPGLFYILLLALPGFRNLSLTGESLMNPFLILSWAFFLISLRRPTWTYFLLTGALVGLAALFRHQAGIQLAVYGVVLLLPLGAPRGFRGKAIAILALAGGFLMIQGAMALVLYQWGAWEAFFRWAILYNFSYIRSGGNTFASLMEGVESLAVFFGTTAFFWFLALVGLWRSRQDRSPAFLSAVVYLAFALVAALPGFRFYPHYFIQCYPPLVYLAYRGWESLVRIPRLKKLGLALSCLGVLIPNLLLGKILQTETNKDYDPLNQRIGAYIKTNSEEGDTLFIWGWGHGIYYYSGRGQASRFMHSDPLSGRISASDPTSYGLKEAQGNIPPEHWEFFLEDMQRNKPLYVVDTSPANVHDYGYFPLEAYPILYQYLQNHYRLETTLDGVKLYRRFNFN